ncbi:hypothetical protein [Neoaquamicrobium microcysteis]|uniref:hypothetical protein n=1 Tax=Neoaquamicrobium microcysteis TaxID=2682781 RepID=UPI001375CCC7|nr:hypothetical protein [Mesorhizobium microcysteis]
MSLRLLQERGALFRQRRVDASPSLRALGMQALDGGIDLAARGCGEAAELARRHDDGDIAAWRVMRTGSD